MSVEPVGATHNHRRHSNGNGYHHDLDQAGIKIPELIVKRDGRVVPFDIARIENAMTRCFAGLGRTPTTPIDELAHRVVNIIAAQTNGNNPTVEGVQDVVEMVLQAAGEFEAAKSYILYRAEHARKREERPVPDEVRRAFDESDTYFPTPLQKFQFFDKYSRFNYDLGRRETWLETVNRSVDFLYELAGSRLPAETYERLRQGILNLQAMPSMRLLAMAGPAARRNNVTIYNCLSGDEKFLTREHGVIALRDAVGSVVVLNQEREWTDAEVRCFGTQETVEIELGRFKTRKRLRVTMNHNWVLADGTRATTQELQPGDEIPYMLAPRTVDTDSIDYRLGMMHGIIYGDGTQIFTQERSLGYVIRLCGDSRELLSYFAGYNVSYPPTYAGDPVVYMFDAFAKTHALKELPAETETPDYLIGFIRGWFAADGYVSKIGQMFFATEDQGEAWLRRVGPMVGFDFGYNVMLPETTNFGVRQKKTRNLEIRRQSVSADDLLLTKHLRNYRQAATDRNWKFLGIIAGTERTEDVYCATVPETHTFTLADGVLTGNCSYQPVESIDSFVEALIISMSGCGVGYSVEGKYVENFPRIKRQSGAMATTFVVPDSAEGWADALRVGLQTWFEGGDIRFDLSQLRPAGAPLRIKGGRASGPEPLRRMLEFTRARVLGRQGSFLRPLDAHDIMCAVGNAAVSGGVRRCLPAGTRVHTRRGAIPIEEVTTHDAVMTAEGYKPVTGWVDQGVQEVVEIVTESGTIFRCTPHHRVAVLMDVWGGHEFKYARDLAPEDRLLFITHPIAGEPQELAPLPAKRAADNSGSLLMQPELNEETGWFLGKFFADGYVALTNHDERGKGGNTMFTVACHTQEVDQIERITAWMEQHGIPARIVYNDGNWVQIRSGNRQLACWMHTYKQANTPLAIPEAIWRSPAGVRAAFIAGVMDGDGCYTDRPVTVLSTAYETFARDVVKLLATLGIIAEIRVVERQDDNPNWSSRWVVSVKDALALQQAAAVLGEHACKSWVPRKGKQAGYTVPGWMVQRDVPRDRYKNIWPYSCDENMNSATLTALVDATHYVPVRIREVRPGGAAHTYDIEVRDGSMFVAEGYLVHNTAMISLFDYDDDEMRLSKNGDFERDNSQRWNANNSAVWEDDNLDQLEFMRRFMEMVESGRGEPGIFNRASALRMSPERRAPAEFGTNPCVTGDTWVLTDQGPRQVADLVGIAHTTLVNGQPYATTEAGFWETGIKPVLRLTTREGVTLRLTANHKVLAVPYISRKTEREEWIEAGALQAGDKITLHNHREAAWAGGGSFDEGWLLGMLVGDGSLDAATAMLTFWGEHRAQLAEHAVNLIRSNLSARADLRGSDQAEQERTTVQSAELRDLAADYGIYRGMKTITPFVEQSSSAFHRGFLRGLFDAAGTVVGTPEQGVSVRLAQSDLSLLQAAQRMLLRLGVVAPISSNGRAAGTRQLADGRGGSAASECRADYELVIANDNLGMFATVIGFAHLEKHARLSAKLGSYQRVPHRERFVVTVAAIEADGVEMVYDCSVPDVNAFDANGLYVHNCGEIILRPWQFCNLTAAVARQEDTFETLRDKVEIATILGTIQSLATHFPGLRPMWRANCEEERLLGVDITGQMDSPLAQDAEVKARLREIVVQVNRETAAQLGINQSAATTCVKPSGNSSQMLDCASGLHARWAPYYIRNVRVATTSPLFKVLRDAGVPMDPENGQTPEDANTWVIHFPVKSPDGAITRNDRSAVQQCEYWLQNKLYWTEHNPSVTITYRPHEMIDLMKWVWEHRDVIGGMAFLPAFDANYAQMPYVEITKEEYERLAAAFPPIDFSKIYRYEDKDLTNAAQELACMSGTCETDLL